MDDHRTVVQGAVLVEDGEQQPFVYIGIERIAGLGIELEPEVA